VSSIRFQPRSKHFKKNNGYETLFPHRTTFPLIGYRLGRRLGYIEMLNDARVASLRFLQGQCMQYKNQQRKKV